MFIFYCRVYQKLLKLVSYVLPWRKPELIQGEGSIKKLPKLIQKIGLNHVLIVTDKGLCSLEIMDNLLETLTKDEIRYTVYDKTVPNPTIDHIEEALAMYKTNHCQGIIAFGGGSPMDCAKGIGARLARPKKTISQMKGLLKVRKKIPTLIAIPTTAGTGSETTVAAVITDSKTHEKYAVNDMSLIPHYAVLDPQLTVGLPPHITSTTGMDVLTHAIEAYIGKSNTKETLAYSQKAVKLIYENMLEAYTNAENLEARKNMQMASFYAGAAFTRAYVGNIHAIAHTLGGFYGTPHGLANAVILPHVLEFYGQTVFKPLKELADLVGIGKETDSVEQKAKHFIESINELNRKMNIPEKISGIKDEDIPLMVRRAFKEANPLYPVPKILTKNEFKLIYQLIKE